MVNKEQIEQHQQQPHDCWDNAVMYEIEDEEGNYFHGHECGICEAFLCAS